ncbi:hypothetical protein [Halococcus agarilyticus]|uniref:hypothetical protein n=1 Tax=Halococcus agarilyticus TaxID=1232219 RepID=UPI0006780641|nr:hypothetical protein [Halococcus agarilyticus]
MPTVWTYPWSLVSEGIDSACDRLSACGVDELRVASHYHSIRTLDPRADPPSFTAYPGGCYFTPDPESFDTIVPPVNEIAESTDPLADVTAAAAEHGLSVNAWCVCLHNTRLGSEYPEYRLQSAFGQHHDHAFCPSYPEVREYFTSVVRSLAEYDIDAINLESLGFQTIFHEHGPEFGHSKQQAVGGRTTEMLFSQCFCRACRERARDHSVDFERARRLVRDCCREALNSTEWRQSLASLTAEYPVLAELFDFRAAVIEDMVADLAAASGAVNLDYSVADGFGRSPGDGWPAGVDLDRLEPHLDALTALCYVSDPELAEDRVRAFDERFDLPVNAGISLDPDLVGSRAEWETIVSRVRGAGANVAVYNSGLMTNEHLDWLRDSFGANRAENLEAYE